MRGSLHLDARATKKTDMQTPMIGSWTIVVKAVKPFTIHGDLYYELQGFRTDDPNQEGFALRVPQHALAGAPAADQKLRVTFLMGQVTAAEMVQ